MCLYGYKGFVFSWNLHLLGTHQPNAIIRLKAPLLDASCDRLLNGLLRILADGDMCAALGVVNVRIIFLHFDYPFSPAIIDTGRRTPVDTPKGVSAQATHTISTNGQSAKNAILK